MDTQGMSVVITDDDINPDKQYPPFKPTIRTIFNDLERKELKQIFKEALLEFIDGEV